MRGLIVAYRRQKITEADAVHNRTRGFNERFTAIAAQLGDAQPAVRLAGVHAMAGLADDWKQNRQTCVDVLCAYLRLPYDPDCDDDADIAGRTGYRANREVRHTIIRLIGAHLRPSAAVSWQGLNFDFTGVAFDGGDFTAARFSGGIVQFTGAMFSRGQVSFDRAEFSGSWVNFDNAEFSGGRVSFDGATFSGDWVRFRGAKFSGGQVDFGGAEFSGGQVDFHTAEFSGGIVQFTGAMFCGGQVRFFHAVFSGGEVSFRHAVFSGGRVEFDNAEFSGSRVAFGTAEFSGGRVDFGNPVQWSHPPTFSWNSRPPTGWRCRIRHLRKEADRDRCRAPPCDRGTPLVTLNSHSMSESVKHQPEPMCKASSGTAQ